MDEKELEPGAVPPPIPMRVVPEPALVWRCPETTCNVQSVLPGAPLVRGYMMGRSFRITCRKCATMVELCHPVVEQPAPRIIVPGAQSEGPNREQRRAAEAMRRKKS